MHILYIHQYFRTPEEGGAIRSYYLAKGMVDAGHEVTMLTSYNGDKYKKMFIDGIHVHYLPVSYHQSMGPQARIWAFLQFVWLVCKKAPLFKKADLCYATSTPLTVGLIALYFKNKFNIPYYFEVRDLWPEAPRQMQVINNKFTLQWLGRWERKIYQNAKALVALSPGIERHIRRIVPSQTIHLISNMSDCQFFKKSERNFYHEAQFNVQDKFVVTYFGAIGKVNHLEYLVDAAVACQEKQLHDVQFLVVGEGSESEHIRAYAEQQGVDNLRFVPYQNKYGLLSVLNVTDAAYVSFDDKPVLQTNSPNKFFDALAAGKLCITNTRGWIHGLIDEHQCGFYTSPTHPEEFVTQIAPFVTDRARLDAYQRNARALAEGVFDRQKQTELLLNSLQPQSVSAEAATAYTSLV